MHPHSMESDLGRPARQPAPRRRGGRSLFGLLVVALVLLVLTVTAAAAVAFLIGVIRIPPQSASAPPPAATEPASTAAAAPAAAPSVPQPKITKQETFGDWIYTCLEVPQSEEVRCWIAQQLSEAQSKVNVFLWRIAQDGKGGLVGIWRTPQGVLLTRGIALDAGTPKPISIPFQTCGNGFCQAVAMLAPDYLDTLAKVEKATATIVLQNGKALNLELSVKGLAEGLAALRN